MPASVRSPASAAVDAGNLTVPKPPGTVDGDLLLAVCFADPDGAAVSAPAGWTLVGSTFSPATIGFGRVYRKAASGEPASYTFTGSAGSSNVVILLAVTGHDAATPLDVAATWGSGAATTSHVAPTISPAGSDSLLVCGFYGLTTGAASSYTPPGGMTERADLQSPGLWVVSSVATEALTASGATGTRTATLSFSRPYIGMSLAVKSSAGGATTHAAAASGASTSAGSAAVTLRLAAAAGGASTSAGSADAGRLMAAAASGSSVSAGSAAATVVSGAVTYQAAASGSSASSGSAAVTLLLAATASGLSASTGSAAATVVPPGPVTYQAAASGVSASGGSASLVLRITAAASGLSASGGSAFPASLLAAAATGGRTSSGSAAATVVGQVVLRPNAGTTSRPGSGTTARPFAGVTIRP